MKKVGFMLDAFSLISALLVSIAAWLAVCLLLEGRRGVDPSAERFFQDFCLVDVYRDILALHHTGTVAIVWSAKAIDTDRWSCCEHDTTIYRELNHWPTRGDSLSVTFASGLLCGGRTSLVAAIYGHTGGPRDPSPRGHGTGRNRHDYQLDSWRRSVCWIG